MGSSVSLALAAALSLSPTSDVDELAADVSLAATIAPSPFKGPASRDAAVLALVAIAFHESGFRPDVADCRVTGDHGKSVSAFQLHQGQAWAHWDREDICRSQPLAAVLALGVLDVHARRCKRNPWRSLFWGYASGNCGRRTVAGDELCALWADLAKKAGIRGATCGARQELTRREGIVL